MRARCLSERPWVAPPASCHPERSERSFAALRMTAVLKLTPMEASPLTPTYSFRSPAQIGQNATSTCHSERQRRMTLDSRFVFPHPISGWSNMLESMEASPPLHYTDYSSRLLALMVLFIRAMNASRGVTPRFSLVRRRTEMACDCCSLSPTTSI